MHVEIMIFVAWLVTPAAAYGATLAVLRHTSRRVSGRPGTDAATRLAEMRNRPRPSDSSRGRMAEAIRLAEGSTPASLTLHRG